MTPRPTSCSCGARCSKPSAGSQAYASACQLNCTTPWLACWSPILYLGFGQHWQGASSLCPIRCYASQACYDDFSVKRRRREDARNGRKRVALEAKSPAHEPDDLVVTAQVRDMRVQGARVDAYRAAVTPTTDSGQPA
jgi:hypothetical protein